MIRYLSFWTGYVMVVKHQAQASGSDLKPSLKLGQVQSRSSSVKPELAEGLTEGMILNLAIWMSCFGLAEVCTSVVPRILLNNH